MQDHRIHFGMVSGGMVAAGEIKSLAIRASVEEAKRQAAARRGDWQSAQEHETELSRIWARYCDLERQVS
jgi:hypothetical protein